MMPYAKFAQTYGFRPNVKGLSGGEAEIGLLACVTKMQALGIMATAQGISAAMDNEIFMSVLQASGASDKQLQSTELQILKSKNASRR